MTFLEKDLEDIIWEADNEVLIQKGLDIKGKKYRQLRIGNYGISDLITVRKKYLHGLFPYLEITVFELKKEKVGISAFLQSLKYCKGIQTYLTEKRPNIEFSLKIVLASKEVDTDGNFIFLTDLIQNENTLGNISDINFYSFKYEIDGIKFKKEYGYDLVNKGF